MISRDSELLVEAGISDSLLTCFNATAMESTTDEVNVPNDRRLQRGAIEEVNSWRQEPAFLLALTL